MWRCANLHPQSRDRQILSKARSRTYCDRVFAIIIEKDNNASEGSRADKKKKKKNVRVFDTIEVFSYIFYFFYEIVVFPLLEKKKRIRKFRHRNFTSRVRRCFAHARKIPKIAIRECGVYFFTIFLFFSFFFYTRIYLYFFYYYYLSRDGVPTYRIRRSTEPSAAVIYTGSHSSPSPYAPTPNRIHPDPGRPAESE